MSSSSRPPPRIEGMISLKVDNLTYRTTSDDLRRVFQRCGDVGDIYIPRDRYTRESRGFAFVRFYDKRDADAALQAMDGHMLDGRELRVQLARYGRPTTPPRRRSNRREHSLPRRRSHTRSRSPRRRSTRSTSRRRSRTTSKSPRGRPPASSRSRSISPVRRAKRPRDSRSRSSRSSTS